MIAQKPVHGSKTIEFCGLRLSRSGYVKIPSIRGKKDNRWDLGVPWATFRRVHSICFGANCRARARLLPALFLFGSWNPCLAADTISLTPGIWKIETTTRLPEISQSLSRQSARCIAISAIDPSTILDNDRHCTISDRKLIGDSMTWSLECEVPGRGLLYGHGEFASQGDRAEGSTALQMYEDGNEVTMITTWKGRRIGECSEP